MSCLWNWVAAHSWVWWFVLVQVVGLAGLLCVGMGYVLGADRWIDRGVQPNRRR